MNAPARAPLPHQLLWEAREIARQHGMRVVQVQQRKVVEGDPVYSQAYVIYRCEKGARRGQRLARRSKPEAVLEFVKAAAGVAGIAGK